MEEEHQHQLKPPFFFKENSSYSCPCLRISPYTSQELKTKRSGASTLLFGVVDASQTFIC